MTVAEPIANDSPVVLHAIDDMLRLTELVRAQRHRDPLRALEDVLLDMRTQVTSHT